MFGFKTTREQVIEERRKNAQLQTELDKTNADIAYLAMMTDVELENENEEEMNNGSEV